MTEEKLRQGLVLVIPQAILAMIAECLSTPKLNSFLSDIAKNDAAILSCVSSIILLESGSKEGAKHVKRVLQTHEKNKLIVQVLFFKLL